MFFNKEPKKRVDAQKLKQEATKRISKDAREFRETVRRELEAYKKRT